MWSDISFQELAVMASENRSLMVFVAEKSASEVDFILQECNAVDLVIFGGVFPAVIVDTEHFDTGILILSTWVNGDLSFNNARPSSVLGSPT